jgi:hypothetical protein
MLNNFCCFVCSHFQYVSVFPRLIAGYLVDQYGNYHLAFLIVGLYDVMAGLVMGLIPLAAAMRLDPDLSIIFIKTNPLI